ncbi:MAG: FAD-binding protein [Gemmatimonadetes bacterium]|nr:FAD-binding protein [Gemmatimonadota bacterium]
MPRHARRGEAVTARQRARGRPDPDALALAAELRRRIEGEVRFDAGSRALYATDASNYRQVPVGVVIPRTAEDVVETVRLCREHGAPILARGGGTSLAGQGCNVAVVIDFSKYLNRILELDPAGKRARVEPGVILDRLRGEAERHHLTFGPDPATHAWCTLGGMIGNNSCGVHSLMAGKTDENVEELEVLTYDGLRLRVGAMTEAGVEAAARRGGREGEIYGRLRELRDRYASLIRERYPRIPRRVSGYNLEQLLPEHGFHVARALVGTESTCVLVLQAVLRLVDSPRARSLAVLGFPDAFLAADHVMDVLAHEPMGLEGIDDQLVAHMKRKGLHPRNLRLLPDGGGWLLVEFGGATKAESDDRARRMISELLERGRGATARLFDDPEQERMVWEIRESGLGATARVPGQDDTWEGWEDSAVPPDRVGQYLRELRRLYDQYGYTGALYGHFGQGCIHTRINFDLATAGGIQKFRSFLDQAAELVLRHGGSLSGEHGDGQARAELLPRMFGPELVQAFREFKAIWDPAGRMNPGKVVDPYPITSNLRLGTSYAPPDLQTHFRYPEDRASFARAALRCVGVGKCRKLDSGTMCPSYMATLEERHSTRGRARLLFEMLEGEPLRRGWRDPHVREALDLCLACKACKRECPVSVDMATYKAEFLAHYYRRRLRPRSAYAMGLVYWWARLASIAPALANSVTGARGVGAVARAAAGLAPERALPRFARHTFREWFRRRGPHNDAGPRVLLWPDTFNNHFHPGTACAAVDVLEAAGYRVEIPPRPLCCGRPLYDFGMLRLARRQLRQILDVLRPQITAGVPVVGLEPSCLAVFRDELINFFPHDETARRLSRQSFLLAEFLDRHADGWQPPPLRRKAIVHGHCHQQALVGMRSDRALLERLGLDFRILDSGCCGMAGSFGFEREKYAVSMLVGERVLLPAVREAAPDTLVVADGFSCREQILQATGRRALHLAEVLRLALQRGG